MLMLIFILIIDSCFYVSTLLDQITTTRMLTLVCLLIYVLYFNIIRSNNKNKNVYVSMFMDLCFYVLSLLDQREKC